MDIQIMTEKATRRSLVIIDELGRGTSTGEGMAIAQAVIEYLHDRVGCKTLVSTHFHELAHLEESLGHLRNHCMAVKESGRQVTFLRKLIRGAASTSYGIYCAEIAGLPDSIIQRSYELLHSFDARAAARPAPDSPPAAAAGSAGGARADGPAAFGGAAAAAGHSVQPLVMERPASMPPPQEEAALHAAAREEAPLHEAARDAAAPHSGQPEALGAAPAAPGLDAAGFVQLSLFAEEPAGDKKRKADGKQLQVIEQLKSADLINMTPLAALNLIYELKQKLQG